MNSSLFNFDRLFLPHPEFPDTSYRNPWLHDQLEFPSLDDVFETVGPVVCKMLNILLQHSQSLAYQASQSNEYFYHGQTGIAFALLQLHLLHRHLSADPSNERLSAMLSPFYAHCGDLLERAWDLLAPDLAACGMRHYGDDPSLFCGHAGAYAVACVVAHYRAQRGDWNADMLRAEAVTLSQRFQSLAPAAMLGETPDEMLYGRSGYLSGALWINEHVAGDHPAHIPSELVASVAQRILSSGETTAKAFDEGSKLPPLLYYWQCEDYLGAAHGLLGILNTLFRAFRRLGQPPPAILQQSLEWVVANRPFYPFALSSTRPFSVARDVRHQFCHGAPGAVYTLLKLDTLPIFLAEAQRLGDITWDCGLLQKGPSLCHGAAGNGFSLLALFYKTHDSVWLERARAFAYWLSIACQDQEFLNRPDEPYSLWCGFPGAILFMLSTLLVTLTSEPIQHLSSLPMYH